MLCESESQESYLGNREERSISKEEAKLQNKIKKASKVLRSAQNMDDTISFK